MKLYLEKWNDEIAIRIRKPKASDFKGKTGLFMKFYLFG